MSASIYPADAFAMRRFVRQFGSHYPRTIVRQAERVAIDKMREAGLASGLRAGQLFLRRAVYTPRTTPPSAA